MNDIPPMSTEMVLRQAGRHEEANRIAYAGIDPGWFLRMRHFRCWNRAREL